MPPPATPEVGNRPGESTGRLLVFALAGLVFSSVGVAALVSGNGGQLKAQTGDIAINLLFAVAGVVTIAAASYQFIKKQRKPAAPRSSRLEEEPGWHLFSAFFGLAMFATTGCSVLLELDRAGPMRFHEGSTALVAAGVGLLQCADGVYWFFRLRKLYRSTSG